MESTRDRDAVMRFLDADPVGTAFVWERGLRPDAPTTAFSIGSPPRAVLGIVRPAWADGACGVAMHAERPDDAGELLAALPRGPVFAHLTDEWMAPLAESCAEQLDLNRFWLFRLDKRDFVDHETAGIRSLGPEWASLVAEHWSPGWDATAYIRSRMDAGPALAIFDGGTPVAWVLTHVESPTVSVIGFIHVLDPYRRRGYALSVTSAIVKDVLRRGKIPALHVQTENTASLDLVRNLGFRRLRRQLFGEGVMR
ncbi:MAG TPA: GNAT family N-acetyltransferase [Thermoplasmata archaeon]|nr:GNAT family N-acetyltransferase [Thermoplasmata archaeon]